MYISVYVGLNKCFLSVCRLNFFLPHLGFMSNLGLSKKKNFIHIILATGC